MFNKPFRNFCAYIIVTVVFLIIGFGAIIIIETLHYPSTEEITTTILATISLVVTTMLIYTHYTDRLPLEKEIKMRDMQLIATYYMVIQLELQTLLMQSETKGLPERLKKTQDILSQTQRCCLYQQRVYGGFCKKIKFLPDIFLCLQELRQESLEPLELNELQRRLHSLTREMYELTSEEALKLYSELK